MMRSQSPQERASVRDPLNRDLDVAPIRHFTQLRPFQNMEKNGHWHLVMQLFRIPSGIYIKMMGRSIVVGHMSILKQMKLLVV
jgi:hypothetical protein